MQNYGDLKVSLNDTVRPGFNRTLWHLPFVLGGLHFSQFWTPPLVMAWAVDFPPSNVICLETPLQTSVLETSGLDYGWGPCRIGAAAAAGPH